MPASYAAAGVDIDAGERAVALMKASVARTARPEVVGGLGGFAGLFRLDLTRYRQPLIAASTDGAGTKTAIARALGRYDTIGVDLVAMVVDDLVVCGAEPLLVQDYVAVGRLDEQMVAAVVAGIADGCTQAGATLLGGETAEHPGLMAPGDFDVAATAVGAVEADALLGPELVRAGDAVVAMASSGLHCNGFSLVRHVLAETGTALDAAFADGSGPDRTVGDELLTPTRIYALDCLAAVAALNRGTIADAAPDHGRNASAPPQLRTFAHVTGGGLAGNLARVIPAGLQAVLTRGSWTPPPVFGWLAGLGAIPAAEMERTFNQGVGMVAVCDPAAVDDLVALLAGRGLPAWQLGEVRQGPAGEPAAILTGDHPTA